MSFNETQTLNESREKKKKKKRGEKTLHDESVSKSQPDGAIGADLTAGSDNGRRCVSTISFLLLPFNPLPPLSVEASQVSSMLTITADGGLMAKVV